MGHEHIGLDWAQWRPHYERIVKELGLDPAADAASADRLVELVPADRLAGLDDLRGRVDARACIVLGNGPGLARTLPRIGRPGDHDPGDGPATHALVAAGAATDRTVHANVWPDVVVTDLDGDTELQRLAAERGALTCIAAHGDNTDLVEAWVPDWPGPILPTCQTEPHGPLVNVGGFTDGDRALYLVQAAGAIEALLAGWDLRTPRPDSEAKAAKLRVARRLMDGLELPVRQYRPGA